MSMLPGKVSEAWVVAINDTNSLSLLNFRLISMSHFCSKVTRGALLGATYVCETTLDSSWSNVNT